MPARLALARRREPAPHHRHVCTIERQAKPALSQFDDRIEFDVGGRCGRR
jgi:hypothetical protein